MKNSSGEVIKKWTDESKKVVDPQSAYIVSDILTDDNARAPLDGHNAIGMAIPGVKTATKTGTSDKGGFAKDIWMVSYSPALTMGVWLGNSDTTILKRGTSSIPGPIIAKVMSYAHKEVYAPEGKWKLGDWFIQPAGIQKIGNELYPSWWNKTQGQTNAKIIFDKVSKKKATTCTPDGAKIEIGVTKMVDPVSKKDIFIAPNGYDSTADDNVHKCDDAKPRVSVTVTGTTTIIVTADVGQGTFPIANVVITIDGTAVATITAPGPYTYTVPAGVKATQSVTATVTDTGLYSSTSASATILAHA